MVVLTVPVPSKTATTDKPLQVGLSNVQLVLLPLSVVLVLPAAMAVLFILLLSLTSR